MPTEDKNRLFTKGVFIREDNALFNWDIRSFRFDAFKLRILKGENDSFINIWSVPMGCIEE